MINKHITEIERLESMGLGDILMTQVLVHRTFTQPTDPLFFQDDDAAQLYPVRICGSNGKTKKEISVKELIDIDIKRETWNLSRSKRGPDAAI